MSRKADGFTLVEIMITVLIMGVLLAIAVPNYRAYRESSMANACRVNLRSIAAAIEEARLERDREVLDEIEASGKIDVLTTGTDGKSHKNRYLTEKFVCPFDKSEYAVEYDDDADTYKVTCGSGKETHDISDGKL